MATTQSAAPAPKPLVLVDQKAGDHSVLVAHARDVIITQLYHHPRILFAVLLLAIFAVFVAFVVGASFVGVKVRFLETLVGIVCRTYNTPPPGGTDSLSPTTLPTTVTPEPVFTPTNLPLPTAITSEVTAVPVSAQCTVTSSRLNVRTGPGTAYPTIGDQQRQGARLTGFERNQNSSWLHIQVPSNDRTGWVSASLVSCDILIASLPIAENLPPPPTSPPVAAVATAVPPRPPSDYPTTRPVPTTFLPPEPKPIFTGSWRGETDQKKPIQFSVGLNQNIEREAVFNVTVVFQPDPPCPQNTLTLTSEQSGLILGEPNNEFRVLGLQDNNASGYLAGNFSGTSASGTLNIDIRDTRDLQEQLHNPCTTRYLVRWTANKD